MLIFSANTEESLRQHIFNNGTYLEKYPARALDMAYTLNQRREHRLYRTFCIVGHDGIMERTAAMTKVPTHTPGLVIVFSGQGAQWPTMGRELILTDQDFRNDIEAMDSILKSLQYPPDWSIEG